MNMSDGNEPKGNANNYGQYPLPLGMSSDPYAECLVEIQETCCGSNRTGTVTSAGVINGSTTLFPQQRVKRKPPKYKALTLGPAVEREVVRRVPFDIYTVNDKNERVAWKPRVCHKVKLNSSWLGFQVNYNVLYYTSNKLA